jgi:hypothetical protein
VLAQELNWSEETVNGFAFKLFGISRQEWLTPKQCSGLIAAMQKILDKDREKAGRNT